MVYLEFLQRLHEVLEPPTYLEIGVRHGDSVALARAATVGIDPAYELHTAIGSNTTLFRETSDEYFGRDDVLAPFDDRPISLAFIDGMHLVEFALRDFINVERHSAWTSVVVFDDVLPRQVEEASRKRRTRIWTGDVYKITGILARHRPDVICLRVATDPTGLLLVLGLDPHSSTLDERYNEIVLDSVVPDPQPVPEEIIERHEVLEPQAVLSAPFWSVLRDARAQGIPREEGLRRLRRALRSDLGLPVRRGPLRRLLLARA